MNNIQMVDLTGQYQKLKQEIDIGIKGVLESAKFIGGPIVSEFSDQLATYLNCKHVLSCANGTDALQIAVMSLNLPPNSEILVPAFTYVATAEVLALLGHIPIMVDVDPITFCIEHSKIRAYITSKTKAIVPVHLFGQCSPMKEIIAIAKEFDLKIIEDNAQSIGVQYLSESKSSKTGTLGDIGCISFFPSKNLGCYGDGGAICTNNTELYQKIKMIANHGQSKKYIHDIIGINSRLDAIQAAVLKVKLKYLDEFNNHRAWVASIYTKELSPIEDIITPTIANYSSHVFHQYTIRVLDGRRDALKQFLKEHGIPSMVYYPIPLYKQKAFSKYNLDKELPITEKMCREVLSLPIHSESSAEEIEYISNTIKRFFN